MYITSCVSADYKVTKCPKNSIIINVMCAYLPDGIWPCRCINLTSVITNHCGIVFVCICDINLILLIYWFVNQQNLREIMKIKKSSQLRAFEELPGLQQANLCHCATASCTLDIHHRKKRTFHLHCNDTNATKMIDLYKLWKNSYL